jgi:hypothetical protein
MQKDIKSIAIDFIKTFQNKSPSKELLQFYHPDIEQIEFLNALTENIWRQEFKRYDRSTERGKKVLLKEE